MTDGADSKVFEQIVRDLLGRGLSIRFQARGWSMFPAIRDGQMVEVAPVWRDLRKDDIVLTKSDFGFRLHRIVRADRAQDVFITRGDSSLGSDAPLLRQQILGIARAKEMKVGPTTIRASFAGIAGWVQRLAARGQVLTRMISTAVRT